MNSEHTRLRQKEQTGLAQSVHEHQQQQHAAEFATVDDLLRYDSQQNPVPGEVGERLGDSIAREPKPERSWFKKLFG